MIRVILFGALGRMGKIVYDELSRLDDFVLVAGVERPDHPEIKESCDEFPIYVDNEELPEADAWVDFSLAKPALDHVRLAARAGIPMVVAATGFDDEAASEIAGLAAKSAILIAPNLSIGIAVMDRIAGEAATMLGSEFDSAIVERHHKTKIDVPSGTALRLADTVIKAGAMPKINSLRMGGSIGEHQVHFVGSDEELIIIHRVFSRRAFSRGVAAAVKFIVGKSPGLYTIRDMLNTA